MDSKLIIDELRLGELRKALRIAIENAFIQSETMLFSDMIKLPIESRKVAFNNAIEELKLRLNKQKVFPKCDFCGVLEGERHLVNCPVLKKINECNHI